MSPGQAFVVGAGTTVAGIWGALPYFAAIDQILKAEVSGWEAILALAYYNAVFVSVMALLVIIRAITGQRADGMFEGVNRLRSGWGKRVIVSVMVLLGVVMLADAVGWLFGYPLIPVG